MKNNEVVKKENKVVVFKTPLWYLKLKSRALKFSERLLWVIFLPFIPAAIIVSLLSNLYKNTDYSPLITGILFVILLAIFFTIFYEKMLKKIRLNKFESFAYYAAAIGLDLDRLSIDEKLYIKPAFSINSLSSDSWWLSRKYKAQSESDIKNSLKDFSEYLDRIYILLKNPGANKDKLSTISKKILSLGSYVNTHHQIDLNLLNSVSEELHNIEKLSRKDKMANLFSAIISLCEKSTAVRGMLYVFFDFVIFCIAYFGSTTYLDIDKNYAFGGSIGLFGLLLIFILNSLRK